MQSTGGSATTTKGILPFVFVIILFFSSWVHRGSAVKKKTVVPTPIWHLPTRCEEGDVNGLLQFEGVWHIFQQWAARPHTSIGHAVSTDLLHWIRLPDALAPPSGSGDDEQCYDGSISIVPSNSGVLTPVLMIDGGCGKKGPGNAACMESTGNGSTGGVTAIPADLADSNLTVWNVSGPTTFLGCDGSAGPSPMLLNPTTGRLQLIAIHGGSEALFEQFDTSRFDAWTMVNASFLPQRGGGGGLWRVLPPLGSVNATWTHIMQFDAAEGDGAPTFSLLEIDSATNNLMNMTAPSVLDIGGGVRYGMLSTTGGTGSGGTPGDQRMLHISWLEDAVGPSCGGSPNIDTGQLTLFREVRYSAALNRLVELPIAEYLNLRGTIVASAANTSVTSIAGVDLLALGTGPTARDIVLNVSIGPADVMNIGVACTGGGSTPARTCGNVLVLTVSKDGMVLTFGVTGTSTTQTFPILPQQQPFPVRILTDTTSVEAFVGQAGEGVFSGGLVYDNCTTQPCFLSVWLSAGSVQPASITGEAWSLNGIW